MRYMQTHTPLAHKQPVPPSGLSAANYISLHQMLLPWPAPLRHNQYIDTDGVQTQPLHHRIPMETHVPPSHLHASLALSIPDLSFRSMTLSLQECDVMDSPSMKRWGMAFLHSARCAGASLRLLPVSTFRSLSLLSTIGGVAAPDGIPHTWLIPDAVLRSTWETDTGRHRRS